MSQSQQDHQFKNGVEPVSMAELAALTAEVQSNITDWSDAQRDRVYRLNSGETLLLRSLPVIVIILLLVFGVRRRYLNRT